MIVNTELLKKEQVTTEDNSRYLIQINSRDFLGDCHDKD